jgi:hypothetical protein
VEAVKAQGYYIYIYPRDLARTIAAQWTIASDAAVSLPPEEQLATFLSEAYQASLLREEDRPALRERQSRNIACGSFVAVWQRTGGASLAAPWLLRLATPFEHEDDDEHEHD